MTTEASGLHDESHHQPMPHHHHEIHFFVDGERHETDGASGRPMRSSGSSGTRTRRRTIWCGSRGITDISYQGQGQRADRAARWRALSDRIDRTDAGFVRRQNANWASQFSRRACVISAISLRSCRASRITLSSTTRWRAGSSPARSLSMASSCRADFPVNPPSGIHVAGLIHPVQGGGTHPTGGIHRDQAAAFQQALGGEWQYWSRPPAEWAKCKKTVAAYMSHVWRLWDSQ